MRRYRIIPKVAEYTHKQPMDESQAFVEVERASRNAELFFHEALAARPLQAPRRDVSHGPERRREQRLGPVLLLFHPLHQVVRYNYLYFQ